MLELKGDSFLFTRQQESTVEDNTETSKQNNGYSSKTILISGLLLYNQHLERKHIRRRKLLSIQIGKKDLTFGTGNQRTKIGDWRHERA